MKTIAANMRKPPEISQDDACSMRACSFTRRRAATHGRLARRPFLRCVAGSTHRRGRRRRRHGRPQRQMVVGQPGRARQLELRGAPIKIKKSNVNQLEVAWFYPYATAGFNPIVVDDVMYTLGPEQLAHRARRDDRQGDLDPRRAGRHHRPRHQLLAERGRQGQAAAVLDQQLPPGDRRADRQVDPDVRQERHRRPARRAARARKALAAASSRTVPARSGRTC